MHIYMPCHMIFDVKMYFTRKSLYVDTWCHAPKSAKRRYEGFFSLESVHIAFTYADINGIDIMEADIQNAYLTSPCSEKYWIRCGPEFGS